MHVLMIRLLQPTSFNGMPIHGWKCKATLNVIHRIKVIYKTMNTNTPYLSIYFEFIWTFYTTAIKNLSNKLKFALSLELGHVWTVKEVCLYFQFWNANIKTS